MHDVSAAVFRDNRFRMGESVYALLVALREAGCTPRPCGWLPHQASYVHASNVQLYTIGFLGKGAVSRRQPNVSAFVIEAETKPDAPGLAGAASDSDVDDDVKLDSGEGAVDGDEDGAAPVSRKRPRWDASAHAHTHTRSFPVRAHPRGTLRACVESFERDALSRSLEDAVTLCASLCAHGREFLPLECARMCAHYGSCPPPRTRVLDSTENSTFAGGETRAVDADGAQKAAAKFSAVKVAIASARAADEVRVKSVRETAVLEPEAAMYLLLAAPGALRLFLDPDEVAYYAPVCVCAHTHTLPLDAMHRLIHARRSGASAPVAADELLDAATPIPPAQAWRVFCATIENFPARFFVYARLRRAGWVVRDGFPFGCDASLYVHGPGYDHAPHCVRIAPLRVELSPSRGTGALSHTATDDAAVHVRMPVRGAGLVWLDVLGSGRVVSTVRKKLLVAFAAMSVSEDVGDAVVKGDAVRAAEPASGDNVTEEAGEDVQSSIADATMRASYYPAGIAAMLSSPSSVHTGGSAEAPDSGMRMRMYVVSRWSPSVQNVKKASALLSRAAAAIAESELRSGVTVDLSMYNQAVDRRGQPAQRIKGCIARNGERYVAGSYGLLAELDSMSSGAAPSDGAVAESDVTDEASDAAEPSVKVRRRNVPKAEIRQQIKSLLLRSHVQAASAVHHTVYVRPSVDVLQVTAAGDFTPLAGPATTTEAVSTSAASQGRGPAITAAVAALHEQSVSAGARIAERPDTSAQQLHYRWGLSARMWVRPFASPQRCASLALATEQAPLAGDEGDALLEE